MEAKQQYRVTGKSGPGVEPKVGMVVRRDGAEVTEISLVDDFRIHYADGMWGALRGGEVERRSSRHPRSHLVFAGCSRGVQGTGMVRVQALQTRRRSPVV